MACGQAAAVGVLGLEDGAHGADVGGGGVVLAGLGGGHGGLEGDEALEQRRRLVLEGEDDGVAAGAHGVADELDGQGRLAGALGAAEEDELAGAQAAVEGGVEELEAGGPHLGARAGAVAQRLVGLLEDVLDARGGGPSRAWHGCRRSCWCSCVQ